MTKNIISVCAHSLVFGLGVLLFSVHHCLSRRQCMLGDKTSGMNEPGMPKTGMLKRVGQNIQHEKDI